MTPRHLDALALPTLAPRNLGIDTLRAVAMLAVVLLHACGPGMRLPVPGLLWPVFESATTWLCDVGFWSARCVASRAFSLVAGFVAASLIAAALQREAAQHGNGLAGLARSRVRRLGWPLLVGILLVLPAMYFVWGAGWVRFGFANWENVFALRYGPAVKPHLLGLGHLWFLAACLASTLVLIGIVAILRPMLVPASPKLAARLQPCAYWLLHPLLRLFWLVPLTAVIFVKLPSSLMQFENGFVPAAGTYLLHALCFGVGALLWLARERLPQLTRWWTIELFLAIIFLMLIAPGLVAAMQTPGVGEKPWYLPGAFLSPTLPAREGSFAAAAAWCALFAALGACLHVAKNQRVQAITRWLVQRQMWVYLLHLLFVGGAWALLYRQAIPSECKALIAFAAGLIGPIAMHAAFAPAIATLAARTRERQF